MATYYVRAAGGIWTTATTWSLTDGGGATGAVPLATDTAMITATSGALSFTGSNGVCLNADFTGYNKNIAWGSTGSLTVSGALVLSATMTIAYTGTGSIIFPSTNPTSIRTNGLFIPVPIQLNATTNITLLDTVNCFNLNLASTSATMTLSGSFGFDVKNELKFTGTDTITTLILAAGVNYKTNKFTDLLSRGDVHAKVISSSPGVQASLIVTGDIALGYLDFTDINANGGRALYSFDAVVSNCANVNSMPDLPVYRSVVSSFLF